MDSIPGSQPRYWAFISYSQRDRKWGRWLHRAIETYRIPKSLIGQETKSGRIPRRLSPVFIDRDELSTSSDIDAPIGAALADSRNLVVICSPSAAASEWVDREILTYKQMGHADRIHAVIVDGEPNASEAEAPGTECFPRSLRFEVGADGELSGQPAEPMAADVRPDRDGRANAKLKVIAGLLGVGFDQLRQRDHQRRYRRLIALSSLFAVLVVVMAALATAALIARSEAERQRIIAEENEQRAIERARIAESRAMAAQASGLLAQDPVRALALALDASEREATFEAENVLRQALLTFQPRLELYHPTRVYEESEGNLTGTITAWGHVNWVEFDPSERLIVTADVNHGVRLWERDTGEQRLALNGHTDSVNMASFDPSGGRIVTASDDHTSRIFRADNGEEILQFEAETEVRSARFDQTGERVLTTHRDGTAAVWDASTGHRLHSLGSRSQPSAEAWFSSQALFSPSGALVATGDDDRAVRIWDTTTGQALAVLEGHETGSQVLSFDPPGARIVTASNDGSARIWDAYSGKLLVILRGHNRPILDACFSLDGRWIVTAAWDGTVRLWDSDSGDQLRILHRQEDGSSRVLLFSPDQRYLAEGDGNGAIRLWELPSFAEIARYRAASAWSIRHLAFSADGRWLLSADMDARARLWEVGRRRELATLAVPGDGIVGGALSPASERIVTWTSAGEAYLWDEHFVPARLPGRSGKVIAAAFSPKAEQLVTGDEDGTVRIWNGASGKLLHVLDAHRDRIRHISFSEDGRLIATASGDGTARVWQAASGAKSAVLRAPQGEGGFQHVSFDTDGERLVTVSDWNGATRIWSIDDPREGMALRRDGASVDRAYFDSEGRVVSISTFDGSVHVWDPTTGLELDGIQSTSESSLGDAPGSLSADLKHVLIFDGNWKIVGVQDGSATALGRDAANIQSSGFNPDASKLVTAHFDGVSRIWDTESGAEISVLRGHEGQVLFAAFSPDGRRVMTIGEDGTARIFLTELSDLRGLGESRLPLTLSENDRQRLLER